MNLVADLGGDGAEVAAASLWAQSMMDRGGAWSRTHSGVMWV
jgi:hypothetical protein